MVWAKAALVGGLLLVVSAFAFGVEHRSSTVVDGQNRDCGSAISASWLVSGTPDITSRDPGATSDERRTAEACRPIVGQSRALVLTMMGVGVLLGVAGFNGTREPLQRGQRQPVRAA